MSKPIYGQHRSREPEGAEEHRLFLEEFRKAGDTFGFRIERAGAAAGPELCFSADALDTLVDKMKLFVLARIEQRWKKTDYKTAPQRMDVVVELKFDGDGFDLDAGEATAVLRIERGRGD